MKKIKFSNKYTKLYGCVNKRFPEEARLLNVFVQHKRDMHEDFISYDTKYFYSDGYKYYQLPSAEYLVLLFMGDNGQLFTTIRSNRKHPFDKEVFYKDAIGEMFEVVITPSATAN